MVFKFVFVTLQDNVKSMVEMIIEDCLKHYKIHIELISIIQASKLSLVRLFS